MTHPIEGRYIDWPLRAALADIDERLRKIEAAVAHPLVTVDPNATIYRNNTADDAGGDALRWFLR